MEYAVGRVGRVVVARLFEGEDLHACIDKIAREAQIRCATVLITGGFRSAAVVVGPEQEKPQIVPKFQAFTARARSWASARSIGTTRAQGCTSTPPSARTARVSSAVPAGIRERSSFWRSRSSRSRALRPRANSTPPAA